jgi:glutathione S-transferase
MFLNENFKTHFGFLESQLTTSPDNGKYLCGKDLTAADILISFPLFAGRSKIDKAAYPKLHEYIALLDKEPGFQRSVKKIEEVTNEPYKSML